MIAYELSLHQRTEFTRWSFAALSVVAAHAAVVSAIALKYTRLPPEPTLIPAIIVSFEPAAPSSSEQNDQAMAQQAVTAIDTPRDPPKAEAKVEQPEQIKPLPSIPDEITLPKPEPKQVEKPVETPPPREAREKAATREALRVANDAASNVYKSLLYGHLQQFKHYPASANGVSGRVLTRFTLTRTGEVIDARVIASSGNAALDQEALATLRRASPFPPFPEAKSGAEETFTAGISFGRQPAGAPTR
jgi:protein TonB